MNMHEKTNKVTIYDEKKNENQQDGGDGSD